MNSPTPTTKKKQSMSVSIQVEPHKLKLMQTILDELINESENTVPAPGRKGHSHKFHGKSLKPRPVAMINPATGLEIARFPSICAAARATGVSTGSIAHSCKNGSIRRKYRWIYLDVPGDKDNEW